MAKLKISSTIHQYYCFFISFYILWFVIMGWLLKDFFADHRTVVATKVSRKHYLVPKDGGVFSAEEFEQHPERYRSIFAEKVSLLVIIITAQTMKFSIKGFFRKCDQIRSFLRIWSHLMKKSVMENFIFCAVL